MTKATKTTLIIIFVSLLAGSIFLLAIYKFGQAMVPGSHPYAETYELNTNENEVIQTINELKADTPSFALPKVNLMHKLVDFPDGRKDSTDHWYHLYFYLKSDNLIVYAWTRPAGLNKTTLAFVGVNEGLVIGHWKEINKDLDEVENNRLKDTFKKNILEPIQKKLKEKGGL